MKQIKNSVVLTLMISSVVLVVALQVFWLRSSYEKAFIDFRRESSTLFRATVFNLRDSLFAKGIVPVGKEDSLYASAVSKVDSIRIRMFKNDTLPSKFQIRERASKVQVFVSSTDITGTGKHILNPLASTIHKFDGQQSFIIRLGPDTLNVDTLSTEFARSLSESGIGARFVINHIPNKTPVLRAARRMGFPDEQYMPMEWVEKARFYGDTLFTERVLLNPMHAYSAAFPTIRTEVIQEITPQILFSLLLTTIIVAAFVVMYRNLRAQQKLMQLKNDFISNVTHELKTPVATVSVALEAMKDFHALENRARTQEYLTIAQNELNRLSLMTDKILKASVFETQGVSFIPEHVDLHAIIEQVMSSMKLVLEKKRIVVNYIPSGNDFEFEGSEVHMTNVVYNLFDNAIKYSGENTSIDVHLHNTEEQLQLSIADHGIGISQEYHKKVFEKFFRVPTGDVHNVKGYGLGLNYVSEVIRSHRGTITLNSSEGEGTCFTITLPRRHGKG